MAFAVHVNNEGSDIEIILSDTKTETTVKIFSFGAILNHFSVVKNKENFNVIDGFTNIQNARENLTPFFKSAKLSPYVCRIKNAVYKFGEQSYRLNKYFANSSAMHGLLYDCNFAISDYWSQDADAGVVLDYVYDNKDDGFPFTYSCSVKFVLQSDSVLEITTTVKNLDEKLMPITDGWHPYFTLGDTINDYLIEFQSKSILEFDDQLIPTGKMNSYENFGSLTTLGNTFFDNCFTLDFTECQPLCVVRNPLQNIQVEFYPDASYPYLQIYTPDSRKSIAIENLSAPPDAFNNGIDLKVLQPLEQTSFKVKFKIKCL